MAVVGALAAAAALAGGAVITVSQAGCSDPGHYVLADGQYHLVGGCVNPDDLTPATNRPGSNHGDGRQATP